MMSFTSFLIQTIVIIIGLRAAYAWGYRSGLAYCSRELQKTADDISKSLEDMK
jgi:hypothetical protein